MLSAAGELLPAAVRPVARRAMLCWRPTWLRPADALLEHTAVPRGARG